MDDIVVFSTTAEDHHCHLKKVIGMLTQANFSLNIKKCQFFRKEIDYLGLRVSKGQVSPIPERTEAVRKMSIPSNKTEVQEFLGLVNFYCDFCPGLAETAIPLYELTDKERDFQWGTRSKWLSRM